MVPVETLLDPIVERGHQQPERLSLVLIDEYGQEQEVRAAQLLDGVARFRHGLAKLGLKTDDLVVLVLRQSLELIEAFWGAMYLGAIPSIFAFPNEKLDRSIYFQQVKTLVLHSKTRLIITSAEFQEDLSKLFEDSDCQVIDAEQLLRQHAEDDALSVDASFSDEKIAFLQHSSGTTGLQKGVALSHRAVLNQLAAYGKAIALDENDVIVSWLPLYHDMGLIAGFIMPIVLGVPLILMSPFHWVRDPAMLLSTMHKYRGTLTWLPNFAFNHCALSIRQRALDGLDLSHWRMAINCSEPVRHDSHRLFLERFAPYGFGDSALATCYAMAENTFAVTQSIPGKAPRVDWVVLHALQQEKYALPVAREARGATPLVSCGFPLAGSDVKLVDDSGQALPERRIGEIAIRGDSMMSEYYRRPELTEQAIRDGWYFSGDMGYLAEGQLYVSGRKKDIIIVGGKNIYPQDVEALAVEVAGVYPGRAVAFGLPDKRLGTEGIVLVCELSGDDSAAKRKEIELALRQRALQGLGIALSDVRLVKHRWLLKTSSGKITRSLNRERYLQEFQS